MSCEPMSVWAHTLICMPLQHIDKTNFDRYFNPVWAKTNKLIIKKKRGKNLLISQPSEEEKMLKCAKSVNTVLGESGM